MSTARWACALVAAAVLTAACAEEPLAHDATDTAPEVADLRVVWPGLTDRGRTPSELVEHQGEAGPSRAFGDDESGSEPGNEWPPSSMSAILSASTTVGFTPTYAYSNGRQTYTGNVGKVTTQATVTFDGQVLGTQPAQRQDYTPYLLDFGQHKSMSVEAYVFIDQDCGLRVDGSSTHDAWWQWFMGGPAPVWGAANRSSQAFPPAEQPPCVEMEEAFGPGNFPTDAGTEGNGPVTCWYWVTYDPYTGEIVDADFLYCESVEGG